MREHSSQSIHSLIHPNPHGLIMFRTALVTNAKRPFSGEMAMCAAAGRDGYALALSQPRHDRYEGGATQPGKAPAR